MKIELVYDQEVRITRRGPYAIVEVNLHPDRLKPAKEKGFDWLEIWQGQETPGLAELQPIVRAWMASGLRGLAAREAGVLAID